MLEVLRSGPLTFALDLSTGWLWNFKASGVEVFQALYPAVRDRNWSTIPTRVTAWSISERGSEVRATFSGVSQNDEIALDWTGEVIASQAGMLQYAFHARARRQFWKNRIGLCIHIPASYAGTRARGIAHDGTVTDGNLPRSIAPHQPFRDLAQFEFLLPDMRRCVILFEGDIFEMEDQRNWTDASFKIYSTPLHLPFPSLVHEGETIFQRITAFVEPKAVSVTDADVVILDCDRALLEPVAIGTQLPPISDPDEIDRSAHYLAILQLDHLRVDWDTRVEQQNVGIAAHLAKRTETPLLISIYATDPAELRHHLIPQLQALDAPVRAFVLHHPTEKVTPPALLEAIADDLRRISSAPLVSGTDFFFAELNRFRYPWPQADWIVFPITPGVHALDNRSLLLNATIQGQVAEAARRIGGGRPVLISPITLRMRRNPNATSVGWEIPRDEQVDPRLHSVFGAAWLLQSLQSLAHARPVAATYFELMGNLGIFPSDSLEDDSHTASNRFTPVARVMHRLLSTARRGARWFPVHSTDPIKLQALGVLLDKHWELLIANPWPFSQVVEIRSIPGVIQGIESLHPPVGAPVPLLPATHTHLLAAIPAEAVIVVWGQQ